MLKLVMVAFLIMLPFGCRHKKASFLSIEQKLILYCYKNDLDGVVTSLRGGASPNCVFDRKKTHDWPFYIELFSHPVDRSRPHRIPDLTPVVALLTSYDNADITCSSDKLIILKVLISHGAKLDNVKYPGCKNIFELARMGGRKEIFDYLSENRKELGLNDEVPNYYEKKKRDYGKEIEILKKIRQKGGKESDIFSEK